MIAQPQSAPASEADLERTAELPLLDVAAFEAAHPDADTSHTDTWVAPVPANLAPAGLETELHAVSTSLRELEGRLVRKSEMLAALEGEINGLQAERAAAIAQAASEVRAREDSALRLLETLARLERAERTIEQQDIAARALEERGVKLAADAEQLRAQLEIAHGVAAERAAQLETRASDVAARDARIGRLEAEIAASTAARESLREELTAAGARAAALQRELEDSRSLHQSSREMLSAREERIARLESEAAASLAARDSLGAERTAATARAGALQGELEAARSQNQSLVQTVTARDERIGRLEAEATASLAARESLRGELAAATTRGAGLQTELEAARSQNHSANQMLAERGKSVSALEALAAQRERALLEARGEAAALRERLAGYLETLSTAEGRRGVYEGIYGELNAAVLERDAQVAAERSRAASLEAEIARLRAALAERERTDSQLRSQLDSRAAEGTALAERLRVLERQAVDQDDVLRGLREEITQGHSHAQELEADLRAAEDTIHRLESELRSRASQYEELSREQESARNFLDEARIAIEQREARIRSLESEAVRSHAALDNIQESMQRLDPLAVTGSEPALEGAARLLIRKDGDLEVVHVLGRRTTIGRTPENDLQIDTKFISRHHAVVLCGPVYTIVEDLNSTNGVLVNGQRVGRHTLKDGDLVTVGKTLFRFVVRPVAVRN